MSKMDKLFSSDIEKIIWALIEECPVSSLLCRGCDIEDCDMNTKKVFITENFSIPVKRVLKEVLKRVPQ